MFVCVYVCVCVGVWSDAVKFCGQSNSTSYYVCVCVCVLGVCERESVLCCVCIRGRVCMFVRVRLCLRVYVCCVYVRKRERAFVCTRATFAN